MTVPWDVTVTRTYDDDGRILTETTRHTNPVTDRLERLEALMTAANADQQHLDQDVQDIGTAFTTAIAELKAQIAAGVPAEQLDFSKADALDAQVKAEAAADAPAPTPDVPPTS